MAILITEGTQLKCSLGAKPEKLKVTSQTFIKIGDKLVATEQDILPMVNIPSFGSCKCNSFNPPCVPSPQKWEKTTDKDNINGAKKLTEDSFCLCVKGGKIEFVDSGKNSSVEVE